MDNLKTDREYKHFLRYNQECLFDTEYGYTDLFFDFNQTTMYIKKVDRKNNEANELQFPLKSENSNIIIELRDFLIKIMSDKNNFVGTPVFVESKIFSEASFGSMLNKAQILSSEKSDLAIKLNSENELIKYCKSIGLNPMPEGSSLSNWKANCLLGGEHQLMISTISNEWSCGYCRKKGDINSLKKWHESIKRKNENKTNSIDSLPEKENKSNSTSKIYIELEDFLYLSNKMVINNQASNNTALIKAFITDEISEFELNVVKEEIKYLMFCLLHFYTFAEVAVNKKILNINDEKALNHFKTISYYSLERSFLTSLNDFDYNLEKYKNRYAKYTHYLGIYEYKDFERSFVECFAAQLTGVFEDNLFSVNIDLTKQILYTAHWVYRTYGETTKLTLKNQNFII